MGDKTQKNRGSKTHGRGKKNGRGAGIRGGRGNAGSFGHKFTQFHKKYGDRYFGGHGFTRPQKVLEETVTCNVGDLDRLVDNLEDEHVTQDGDVTVLDLDAAGIDKLLGGGKVHRAVQVRVAETTDKALDKVEGEGGRIELLETDEDEESSDEGEEPPSSD